MESQEETEHDFGIWVKSERRKMNEDVKDKMKNFFKNQAIDKKEQFLQVDSDGKMIKNDVIIFKKKNMKKKSNAITPNDSPTKRDPNSPKRLQTLTEKP